MKVTIQQIADRAGVSRGTVDRALNRRGRIKPDVEEKIKAIAKELNYIPRIKNAKAINYTVALILHLSAYPFMRHIKRGLKDSIRIMRERGIKVIIMETESVDVAQQLKYLDKAEELAVDGIAIMPTENDEIRNKLNHLITNKRIPVVTFNSDIVGVKRSCFVGLNNYKSGQTAAGLFALLTKEEGKFLVISGNVSNSVNNERVAGFIEEINGSFPKMAVVAVQISFDSKDTVQEIIKNNIAMYEDLRGIFIVSGGQAGIYEYFAKHPQDKLHIIAYDIIPANIKAIKEKYMDFIIDQNGYEQGFRSLGILSEIIINNKIPKQEKVYTDIIIKNKYNI